MRCQWEAYIKLLPGWLQEPVNRLGRDALTELRLRIGQPPQLILMSRSIWLGQPVTKEDIDFCINIASQYSPWTTETMAHGFITAAGGHRIGICGETIMHDGKCAGFCKVTSLCIRVARDIPGLADKLNNIHGSILIIGPPGSGKTTLLRDLIRLQSACQQGSIAVLDERNELFPFSNGKMCFELGPKTDVLNGCSKAVGIDMLIRCMGPAVIAVDEITASTDCTALVQACWCGVKILATAHAFNKEDLYQRAVYRPLVENSLFQNLIILQQDKSWYHERMGT